MSLFKDKKGIPEPPKEEEKKPAVAGWRVRFYRKGRKFNMTCEHLDMGGRRFRDGEDSGYINLMNILEAPLDDVGYDITVQIDNIISIEKLGEEQG